jgi:uncharacterized protein
LPTAKENMIINLDEIKILSASKANENDDFVDYLKQCNTLEIDNAVYHLTQKIEPQIDCTACGNCCKTLMINVTQQEAKNLSKVVSLPFEETKEKYLEQGLQQSYIMKSMPCSFLNGTKCSIYEDRFEGCKEFPNLYAKDFTKRLFTTMMHYDRCPIIFNVIEELKIVTNFIED